MGANIAKDKFKDVILVEEGFYYTVYIAYCRLCGCLKGDTWVE